MADFRNYAVSETTTPDRVVTEWGDSPAQQDKSLSEVAFEVARGRELADRLEGVVQRLSDRLEPILRPQVPVDCSDGQNPLCGVKLADQLATTNERLGVLIAAIESLEQRAAI